MAAPGSTKAGEATQLLKYNTWVLKVPIHCLGCKREVKKLLQRIDGDAGNGRKRMKGKGQNGNCGGVVNGGAANTTGLVNDYEGKGQGVNLSPSFEEMSSFVPNQGSETVQVMNYNAAHPSKIGPHDGFTSLIDSRLRALINAFSICNPHK
ncbi:hypothetical protein BVRB_008030 [Beta vulgaris subsp. vulgaris]|uniref:HMA domain-containing protein n=1 Tax=Beta vulgaris subsp. vulgaris TaxID=3555 RepID=A0A0J8B2W7_BETVV|nr:hypothetical protein BVRB_008030 [Beta vulgaris subsp. vulgaris]